MSQVMKLGNVSFGTRTVNKTTQKAGTDTGFQDFMSANMSNSEKKNGNQTVNVNADKKNDYKDLSANKVSKVAEDTNSTNQVKQTKESSKVSEESVTVDELEKGLKEEVAKVLDISEEELSELLVESGLTVFDLLNPEVAKNFFLEVEQVSDTSQLITDEALLNKLNCLLDTISTFEEMNPEVVSINQETNEFSEKFEEFIKDALLPTEVVKEDEKVDDKKVTAQTELPVITVEKEENYVSQSTSKENEQKDSSKDSDHTNGLQQFVENLAKSVAEPGVVEEIGNSRVQEMQEIVNQVVERIKVTLTPDVKSMEMQLNPENLGKVHVSVISREGQMTATFAVENQIAKEALESQLSLLKDNLNEQGLKVDAIEVTVAEHGLSQQDFSGQQQGNFQNSTKKSSMNRGFSNDSEEEEEETDGNQVMENGIVDFSA